MIRQRLTGLAATVGIAVLLVGLPALLLQVGLGNLPTITDWSDVVALLLRRDDGTLALVVIKALGWVTWAMLGALILLEIVTRIRGVQPRDLPGLHLPQVAARQLVAAAAALFVALPGPTLAYADPLPAPASIAGDAQDRQRTAGPGNSLKGIPGSHRRGWEAWPRVSSR